MLDPSALSALAGAFVGVSAVIAVRGACNAVGLLRFAARLLAR